MVEKYGKRILEYVGGPIAVSNCEVCGAVHKKDMCYHCGKQPWMRSRTDLKTARRDIKAYTRYHLTKAIHAATMASNLDMVEKIVSVRPAECPSFSLARCPSPHAEPMLVPMLLLLGPSRLLQLVCRCIWR